MSQPTAPPRLARRILEYALPADVRDDIPNDLAEVFQRQLEKLGLLRARLWYWHETMTISRRFLTERIRERRHAKANSPGGGSFDPSSHLLDFKLGLRMLVKYPGLALAGGLAMVLST